MKKICIITTGGTIAMREDREAGGLVPAVSGEELAASAPGLTDWADIEVREFSNIPSEFMTPEIMLRLAHTIDSLADEADGFVVTHGTDTMEETAFLLDTVLRTEKPVVLTGAMRGASDLSADGPANLLGAVKTAADPGAEGMGVLVVMGDRIHAAQDVEKEHATLPEAFRSVEWGPVGTVCSDRICWGRRPIRRQRIHPDALAGRVWLIKCGAGTEEDIFQAAAAAGVDGVVVEGFGCGNVSRGVDRGIHGLLDAGIPVVLVSRTAAGSVAREYAYEGGAASLEAAGAVLGGSLSGQKARLLLMAALGAGLDREAMRDLFR